MSNEDFQKNIFLKRDYMRKRFGLMKSLQYRKRQFMSFAKVVRYLLTEIYRCNKIDEQIKMVKRMYDYFYKTRDIWAYQETIFTRQVKSKIFEFSNISEDLKVYLVIFGYICPYIQMNGQICGTMTDGLCDVHKKCKDKWCNRVTKSLQKFPEDICNIVSEYSFAVETPL